MLEDKDLSIREVRSKVQKACQSEAVDVYFKHETQERSALGIDRDDSADASAGGGFIRDLLSFVRGAVAAIALLASGIHLLASLGVALFLYVFHKAQS